MGTDGTRNGSGFRGFRQMNQCLKLESESTTNTAVVFNFIKFIKCRSAFYKQGNIFLVRFAIQPDSCI